MIVKGGCVYVDCTGLDLIKGSTPQTIAGLRAQCETALASNKPVYAQDCNWNGAAVTPIAVMLIKIGDDIIATTSTLQIVVSELSVVTIVNMVG